MPEDNTKATPSMPPVDPTVATTPVADEPASASAPAPSEPTTTPNPVPEPTPTPTDSTVVEPVLPPADANQKSEPISNDSIHVEVAKKIAASKNVLIALSSDPSVDEMAAAIGLSLFLDKIGKRATAIYSGSTPNALEFLKPEETFEPTADTLQDFVIALNKDKADHLRYKLDGDFVKIYITPYRTRISEEDLDFSYGDFNVDLVLALDVANGIDLDSALREHGRIMHDAVIINITTGKPGKFGEIEWSDKTASSVSEMIAGLLYKITDAKVEKEEATAFLTGIVAATNRFSNATTTPTTMKLASKLMESGANQQLVSKNITPDVENEMASISSMSAMSGELNSQADPTKLDIQHDDEPIVDETKEIDDAISGKESTLLDELKAAEASLAGAVTEVTPEENPAALKISSDEKEPSLTEPPIAPILEEPADEKVEETPITIVDETPEEIPPEAPSEKPKEVSKKTSEEIPEDISLDDSLEETTAELTKEIESMPPEAESESTAPIPEPEPTPESVPASLPQPEPTPESVPASLPQPELAPKPTPTPEPTPAPAPQPEPATAPAIESKPTSNSQFLVEPIQNSEEEEEVKSDSEGIINPVGSEKVIQPTTDLSTIGTGDPADNKYGQMLEAALQSLNNESNPMSGTNPAAASTPSVPEKPEINGVPEMNYMPMPSDEILPPPPAPPIDMANVATPNPNVPPLPPAEPIVPATPKPEPTPESLGSQPAMQDQIYAPQAADPSAFKIPGM